MAIQVKPDIIEGSSVTKSKGQITEATRAFFVTGLTEGSGNPAAQAMNHASIPTLNAAYYGDVNVTMQDVRFEGVSTTSGKVICTYRRRTNAPADEPNDALNVGLSISTRYESIQTQRDRDGNPIKIFPPARNRATGNTPADNKVIAAGGATGTVTVDNALVTATFRKQIETNDPEYVAFRYGNKINSVSFRGKAKYEWRVTAISADLVSYINGTQTYQFTFEFTHNPEKWQPVGVYINPETNEPD